MQADNEELIETRSRAAETVPPVAKAPAFTLGKATKPLVVGLVVVLAGAAYWLLHDAFGGRGEARAHEAPGNDYRVSFDAAADTLTLRHPEGKQETLKFSQISQVTLVNYRIEANGAQYEFTNWVLHHPTGKLAIPFRALSGEEMLRLLAERVPGFDPVRGKAAIDAAGERKEGVFVVWPAG